MDVILSTMTRMQAVTAHLGLVESCGFIGGVILLQVVIKPESLTVNQNSEETSADTKDTS